MHEKLQGPKKQGKLIKKQNEGKKKLELAYISNDNFFCVQVKVIVFSNTGERATPYIRQAPNNLCYGALAGAEQHILGDQVVCLH
jgi:hypothetical protein